MGRVRLAAIRSPAESRVRRRNISLDVCQHLENLHRTSQDCGNEPTLVGLLALKLHALQKAGDERAALAKRERRVSLGAAPSTKAATATAAAGD